MVRLGGPDKESSVLNICCGMFLRRTMLQVYRVYGTIISVILEAPTVDMELRCAVPTHVVCNLPGSVHCSKQIRWP